MGFVMEVGPRGPGFVNWLKYRKVGCARGYLFFWRMWWSSCDPKEVGPYAVSFWAAFRYAARCRKQLSQGWF